jgi:hypothetical protein
MTSTLQTSPESPKTAYVGGAAARSTDRCLGARLHSLLAAGLATLLVSLGVAVRPLRTYTAEATLNLPASPSAGWSAADAAQDGLAVDSGDLATQLAATLKDDAALAHAAETAGIQASPAGAAALLHELRSVTKVAPNATDTTPGAARVIVESKNSTQAQAFALALADDFAVDYRNRALIRGRQAVAEARQAVSATAAQAQESQRAFERFLASHFAEAATALPAAPKPEAPSAEAPRALAAEPAPADPTPAAPAPASQPLPTEAELQQLKQRRRELLVRYTKYHYKVQEVDMHIARLEKELAILAPHRADALPNPQPAPSAPEPDSPTPNDESAVASNEAREAEAAAEAAKAETERQQLNEEFESLRVQAAAARDAAEQAVLQERSALEHQAALASQAELRVAAPSVTYRTAEGLDRRGVSWSLLLAATVGGVAFCLTGPQKHVYRTPAEVEDDLELPLVAALASRSAALPRRPRLWPAIAARLTACGELVLVTIVCGLAVLAYLEPTFRTQLIDNPLAAYTDAASRMLGR